MMGSAVISNEERLKILRMVEDGKINAEEGVSLFNALGREGKVRQSEKKTAGGSGKWFRVRITDLSSGRSKATVNIPIELMNWGLRIGAQFAPEVADFDLNEIIQVLEEGVQGKIVEVLDEEDGEHVEIFIE